MRALNDAAKTAAEAAWPEGQVHLLGEVPPNPTMPYLVLSVTSGRPDGYTLDVTHGFKAHRLVAQAVGRTLAEVSFAVEKADEAFEDQALTVTDLECGPLAGPDRVASPVTRDPDADGVLTCTVLYPFTVSAA